MTDQSRDDQRASPEEIHRVLRVLIEMLAQTVVDDLSNNGKTTECLRQNVEKDPNA